ncbi:MAG: Ig-like domain-containing protein [Nitrospirota bacterium]
MELILTCNCIIITIMNKEIIIISILLLCMIIFVPPMISYGYDKGTAPPGPAIISVFPDSGSEKGNNRIIITGSGFTHDDLVFIGGSKAVKAITINSTTIKAITPEGSEGKADIVVQSMNGEGVLENGFTYLKGDPERVLAVNPMNGLTELPLNMSISMQFSISVDPLTIDDESLVIVSQKLNKQVNGSFLFDFDNTMVIFKPFDNLDMHVKYIIFVTQKVKSKDGIPLDKPFMSSFSTCKIVDNSPPDVIIIPKNGTTDIPFNNSLIFMFNEPLNPITVNSYTIRVFENEKIIDGDINIGMNNTVVTFAPKNSFSPDSSIIVVLSPKLTDIAGNYIGGNDTKKGVMSSFGTSGERDIIPPDILQTTPSDGANGVNNRTRIYIEFSEPINPLTIKDDTFSVSIEEDNIGGRLFFSKQNTTLVYIPYRTLPTLSVVEITLNKGIKDMAGNTIKSPIKTTFITQPADDLPLSIAYFRR